MLIQLLLDRHRQLRHASLAACGGHSDGAGTLAGGPRQRQPQAQRVDGVRQRRGCHARARARRQALHHRQAAVLSQAKHAGL